MYILYSSRYIHAVLEYARGYAYVLRDTLSLYATMLPPPPFKLCQGVDPAQWWKDLTSLELSLSPTHTRVRTHTRALTHTHTQLA